jgi:GT2 family glycosyltransferase
MTQDEKRQACIVQLVGVNGTLITGRRRKFMVLRAPDNSASDPVDRSCPQYRSSEVAMVSVIIVNTNELHHLKRCLPSVCHQSYSAYEVIVVDNDSSDGSIEFIQERFPNVRLIQSTGNLGYPGANNIGFEHACGDYFAVLNPDTIVDHHWIKELVRALDSDQSVGLATSKILLMSDSSRINACGNEISFTGLTYCRGVNELASNYEGQAYVAAVSGAAFMIRKSVVEEIGSFDDLFVAYLEETDLSLRGQMAGYRSLFVPDSVVLHDYTFRFSERKCFHIEKNRIYMLIKVFRKRTLLLLSPLLTVTEGFIWLYMMTHGRGHLRQKWLSYVWLWRNRFQIIQKRNETQHIRKLNDREILRLFVPRLPLEQVMKGTAGHLLNRVSTSVIDAFARIPLRFAD